MGIVEKAKKDPRIKPLFEAIREKVKVKFHRSEVETWGSRMESGIAHISYQKCNDPVPPMAHELLHIDTQLNGYRNIIIGISTYDRTPLFGRFMTCLNNELQHHKFYKKYLKMALPANELYCEDPVELEEYIKGQINKRIDKLIEIIPDFFTLIAPGGCLADDVKVDFLKQIVEIKNGAYQNQLNEIERIVTAWRESDSYDNLPVIRDIMLVLQPKPNYTWFGFNKTDRPPDQGFFVDKIFKIENDNLIPL